MLNIQVQVEQELLVSLNRSPKEFGEDLLLWAAISLYEHGKLSLASAANLAGYHRYDFEKLLSKMDIPISNLELEDIQKDIALLSHEH
jgi:predicted HTH domain antitoxin